MVILASFIIVNADRALSWTNFIEGWKSTK